MDDEKTVERERRVGSAVPALPARARRDRNGRSDGDGALVFAAKLAKRCGDRVLLLHDRRIPRRWTSIDHIAVARSGVWVIDTKRCTGKVRVSRTRCGQTRLTVTGSDNSRLIVAGRDRTRLVDGLAMRVELVAAAVAEVDPTIAVHGAMCFVGPRRRLTSSIPVLRTLRVRGYALMRLGSLARRLNRKGHVSEQQMTSIASMLARRFPTT